jgi:hypothetical protein
MEIMMSSHFLHDIAELIDNSSVADYIADQEM